MRLASLKLVLLLAAAGLGAGFDRPGELEDQGRFKEAAAWLRSTLASTNLPQSTRAELRFELDRLERIKKDFPLTRDALYEAIQKSVRDVTVAEFEKWIQEGRFDSREIDGERRFMVSSVSNLFFRYPGLNARRMPPRDTRDLELASWQLARSIKAAAREASTPRVLPRKFEIEMTLTARPGAAPDGQTVRAWVPVPRESPSQSDFRLLSSAPECKHLDPPSSPIRSAYLEKTAVAGRPTEFTLSYSYTSHGLWFEPDPARVRLTPTNKEVVARFTAEGPHIRFTPAMRDLSRRIAGEETHPLRKARLFYEWIAENIRYSYAVEYSTIRDLGEYCRQRGYGDCGQEALLFMTLCRLNGIPARWQSGWSTFPKAKTIHDWTEIYFEPYGWVPVDPYMGIYATQYAPSLSPEQKRELRDFYFGGLDQYRMIANSDHNQILSPRKQSFRSDNVDFQRGELEWDENNIYFDQFTYEVKVKEIEPGQKME